MRPENLALQVKSEVQRLPRNAKVKFIPSLWQVWILGRDGNVLVFDLRLKSWCKRKFNSEILDVFEVGEDVDFAFVEEYFVDVVVAEVKKAEGNVGFNGFHTPDFVIGSLL